MEVLSLVELICNRFEGCCEYCRLKFMYVSIVFYIVVK